MLTASGTALGVPNSFFYEEPQVPFFTMESAYKRAVI